MTSLWNDVKYGLRMLARSPGFAVVAVVSLALGIGANTAIFSLLNAVLLRSLPVRSPHELRIIHWVGSDLRANRRSGWEAKMPGGLKTGGSFAYPTYLELRDQATGLSDLTAFATCWQLSIVAGNQAFVAPGLMVSGNFFKTLGLQAAAGRTLAPEDDQPAAAPATVISHACWRKYFSADPRVLGASITVNRHSFTIVGVLPEGFHGLHAGRAADFYVPMSAQPQVRPDYLLLESKDHWWVEMLGRLAPGADERQVVAALNVLFSQSVGPASGKEWLKEPSVILEDGSRGPLNTRRIYAQSLAPLLGIVGLVLLVACANLAGLLLARTASREHETAVRAAIGASPWRLVRQALTESLLIAVLGTGMGLLLAAWGKTILFRLLWPSIALAGFDLSMDGRILAFTLMATVATALLFGLVPAFHSVTTQPVESLKDRSALGTPRLRLGKALVAAQVGLSLLLVTAAGFFVRTLVNLTQVDPGYDTQNLLVFRLAPEQAGYKDQRALDFYRSLNAAISTLPGVRNMALSDGSLLSGYLNTNGGLIIPGRDGRFSAIWAHVSPSFLTTMGIPLVLGRDFTEADDETAPWVTIINEALAQFVFPRENPIGRVIRMGSHNVEIVGVCRDIKHDSLKSAAAPALFLPYRQDPMWAGTMYVEVRTALDPMSLVPAVRKAVAAIDLAVPMADITTQRIQLDQSVSQERLFATLCSALAGLAVLLSCIGLYGLLAYRVARRTGEIGIRMALGAGPRDVAWPVLRDALLMATTGVAIGIPIALATARLIRSRLFGIEPHDPITLIGAAVMLLVVAILAAWIPARRAAKVDPMVALRCE